MYRDWLKFTLVFKGNLPLKKNLKRGHIDHINSKDIGCLKEKRKKIDRYGGAKSSWLPSMCEAKSAFLPSRSGVV